MEGIVKVLPARSEIEKLKKEIMKKTLKVLRRSLYVLRVDTGSCNGCEIEIFAALTPLYDAERFGVRVVVSPRHADVLLVTGPVTRQFKPVLLRVYNLAPDPKVVIAVGACGCGGGIWYNSYAVYGGVDQVIPVDVYVPGCPPHPAAILHGILVALDILEQKINRTTYHEREPGKEWKLASPLAVVLSREKSGLEIPWELYREISKVARRYLGYVYGEQLLRDYINALLKAKNYEELVELSKGIISAWNNDPRVAEVVSELNSVVEKFIAREKTS